MLTIITKKHETLKQNNTPFYDLLQKVMGIEAHPALWQQNARDLLYKIISRLTLEEGLKKFNSPYDEEKLKEHLPYHISNAIDELLHITIEKTHQQLDMATKTTALFLFFKLIEWFGKNYHGVCIYGDTADMIGLTRHNACQQLDVIAEKDEVWLEIDTICQGWGYMKLLENTTYGCMAYSAEIYLALPYTLPFETSGHPIEKSKGHITTALTLTAYTKTADITSAGVRCELMDGSDQSRSRCFFTEKNILNILKKQLEGVS